jgi:hypothetical protein
MGGSARQIHEPGCRILLSRNSEDPVGGLMDFPTLLDRHARCAGLLGLLPAAETTSSRASCAPMVIRAAGPAFVIENVTAHAHRSSDRRRGGLLVRDCARRVAGRALVTRRERPISMKSGTTERP